MTRHLFGDPWSWTQLQLVQVATMSGAPSFHPGELGSYPVSPGQALQARRRPGPLCDTRQKIILSPSGSKDEGC